MDPRERMEDPEETMRAGWDDRQAKMRTAGPAIVESYDAATQTVKVRMAIKSFVKQPDGTQKAVELPMLQDVPVQMQGGGEFSITKPHAKGDEMLIVFSDRSPDAWQQSGGVQLPVDASMHSLSHGFAIPGFRSQPRKLPGVSTNSMQIRNDAGTIFIEIAAAHVLVNVNGMLIKVTPSRVDLGGLGGSRVITEAGPSNKVYAIV